MDCSKCVFRILKRGSVYFPFTKHIVFCSLECWNKYLNTSCCHCGNPVHNKTSFNCMRLSGTTMRFCNETCYNTFTQIYEDKVFDALERGERDLSKYRFSAKIQTNPSSIIYPDFDTADVDIGAKSGPFLTAPQYFKVFA